MNNDSKSTLHGNKTDQDQLTDDQLQAASGSQTCTWSTLEYNTLNPFDGAVATADIHAGR